MVSTYAEMLQKKFGGTLGPAGEEYVRYVVEGATRMEQLLRDLRVFTQAATVAQETAIAVDATVALRRSLANLTAAILGSEASITYDSLPSVCLPEFQLAQLFQNIIGNAIRYRSEQPPEIHISAVPNGDMWRFSIQDNGIGINPEYKERIFGIFKRLHTRQEYPGTGIGLAICRRIVDRAGGRIWVESEPGRGSTFYFTLPADKSI